MDMHIVKRLYLEANKRGQENPLFWPPDVFAVCCYFARVSGAYLFYSSCSDGESKEITDAAVDDGARWRSLLDKYPNPEVKLVPRRIRDAWRRVGKVISASENISELTKNSTFVRDALFLIACSDEACVGIGIPSWAGDKSDDGYFEFLAELVISKGKGGTLCRNVSPESVRVLPKQHTPQSGFNIRSLTHHLALCNASEVAPEWVQAPIPTKERSSYNVLLAPWPVSLNASDIKESKRAIGKDFGFFDFDPHVQKDGVQIWLSKLLDKAQAIGQEIDLVLLPECALSMEEWNSVSKFVVDSDVAIISGVRDFPLSSASAAAAVGQNMLKVRLPLPDGFEFEVIQHKHHRWKLDASQIGNYGLGGTLHAKRGWWENIELKKRRLNFLAFRADLVVCPLICEDLARQDPVAELVRSVGPNLVIALLMDGPQIAERWPARYATVLADDPGSSVLTLTSMGMVQLSRPAGSPVKRAIACWKEASGKFISLELAPDEAGLVLNLQFDQKREWSLDGRHDGGAASAPTLRGVHRLII